MHIAALVSIDGSSDRLDAALAGLTRLSAILAQRSHALLSLAVSSEVLEAVRVDHPELAAQLPDLPVDWVRRGWGEPDLTILPDRVAQAALEEETDLLEQLGLQPGPFWIRHQWDPRLPFLLSESGVSSVLVDRELAGSSAGVVVYLDRILPAVTVEPAGGSLPTETDELVVWNTPLDHLVELISTVAATPGCDLTTPDRYLADHRVSGRLPMSSTPRFWDDEADLLHRKLVRLATRLPERPSREGIRALLGAASPAAFSPGASPRQKRAAHRSLIEARSLIDRARRRGDDWGHITRLDWDADGDEEIHIETAELSVVLDPRAGCSLLVLDHKPDSWPVAYLAGEAPGRLCRVTRQDGQEHAISFAVERTEETKGEAVVELKHEDADLLLGVEFRIRDRQLVLSYRVETSVPIRLGPELNLAVGEPGVRIDGSAWAALDHTRELAGHRFRLAGDDRQVLLTCMVPTDLVARPASDGLVAWAHWSSSRPARYELTLDL